MFLLRAQIFLERTMEISQLSGTWYRVLTKANTATSSISKPFFEIATISLLNGDPDEAQKWYTLCLKMEQTLHGSDADQPSISSTMHQLGRVAQEGASMTL